MDLTFYTSMQESFSTLRTKKSPEEVKDFDNHLDYSKYLHHHNFHELYFLLDGSRSYIIEDELISVNKYDCIIVKKDTLHKTFGGNGFDRFLIYFKDEYCERYITPEFNEYINKIFTSKKISLTPGDFYKIKLLLKQLESETDIKQCITFLNIITILTDNIGNTQAASNDLISDIAEYVNVHFKELLSLEEIANEFLISKEHLCRIFKNKFGISIITYLNTIKIKYSCQLLTSTDMNITDISIECGFNTPNYFCRIFKRIMGCTPKEYKRRTTAL